MCDNRDYLSFLNKTGQEEYADDLDQQDGSQGLKRKSSDNTSKSEPCIKPYYKRKKITHTRKMIGSRIAEMKKLNSPGFSPSRSCQDKFPSTVGEDEEVNLSNPNLSVNGNRNRGNSINGDVKSSFHRAAAGKENNAGSEGGVGIKLLWSFDYTSSPYYIAHKSAVLIGSNMPHSPSSSRNKGGEPPPPPPLSDISNSSSFSVFNTTLSHTLLLRQIRFLMTVYLKEGLFQLSRTRLIAASLLLTPLRRRRTFLITAYLTELGIHQFHLIKSTAK